ncbi:ArsR/SmtB family transcription factor [Pseudonocardia sp. TRM90224]|uniref:ArsR/SmtB family transcription factor n=1 Tax=Pseudonocardia sp. TRM90224 TaxID=2812678 RepID=UPI001E550D43|nr:DUF5937 family protein [Pseudonocardia sp. TRM90224]
MANGDRPHKTVAANAVTCLVAVTLIVDPAATGAVTVRRSPLAELCACLHSVEEAAHHPFSAGWVARVHASVDPGLLARAATFAPLWSAFRARYMLPLTATGSRTIESELAELAELAALPIDDFTAMTVQALIGKNSTELMTLAAAELMPRLRLISSSRLAIGMRVRGDPVGFRAELVDFLAAFAADAFAEEWAQVRSIIDRAAADRDRDIRRRGPQTLTDLPTHLPGDDPTRFVFDKLYAATAEVDGQRPCVLVPTAHGRPHFVIKHFPGYPVVVQYSANVATAPSVESIRRTLAALLDPTRLQVCYAILRTPVATAELATQLRMTRPQVSRHLRSLREAGLVHTHRNGAAVYYQLDIEAIERIGPELLSVLYR